VSLVMLAEDAQCSSYEYLISAVADHF